MSLFRALKRILGSLIVALVRKNKSHVPLAPQLTVLPPGIWSAEFVVGEVRDDEIQDPRRPIRQSRGAI